jgi:hypothetical protein
MPFTLEQKRRLMRAYAPVLFLHQSELFVPISPSAYLERAALWNDEGPGSHRRELWGQAPTTGGGGLAPPSFPRTPLLAPGQLTVDPGAAGGDVHYLGEAADGGFPFTQSDAEHGLFLDFRGWWEDGDLPDFANEPGQVLETTQNRSTFIKRLKATWEPWRPEDPAEPMPPEVAMIEPFRRRLSADVHDWVTLSWAVNDSNLISMLGKIAGKGGTQNLWFIFYHFFYPAHEEGLRWCEFVALLNNLNKELPDEVPSTKFEEPGVENEIGSELVGLHRADYAGDWSTVCVVVQASPDALPSPSGNQVLPENDSDLPPPRYVGLGQRVRSQVSAEGRYTFDQLMKITEDFGRVGSRHVKVFVGRGTHNNFAAPGQHPSPRGDSVLDSACDVNGTDEDSDAPVDDRNRKRRLIMVGLLKVLLGILLGLPVLPEVGAIGLGLEGMRSHDPHSPFGPDEPSEDTPPSEDQAMIIAPTEVLDGLGLSEKSAWQIEDGTDLVDGQIWWPPPVGPANGYRGAWGVTCAEDPFDARSGMPFPDTRPRLIESLAIFLEQH